MTTAIDGGSIPPIRLEYRLLLARLEADLSAQELADRMGVSRDVVSRAENARTRPRKIVLNAWALATGVPISWLRDGIGEMATPPDPTPVRPKGFEPPTFCFGVRPENAQVTTIPRDGDVIRGPWAELRAAS